MLSLACSEEFFDLTPPRIVAKLADRGEYVASESSFYRLLRSKNLMGHRSRASRPKKREVVETIADRPNQVWTWDITHLRSDTTRKLYNLYLFEDLFSRKIVGWDILETAKDGDAIPIIKAALRSEGIDGKGLRIHSDNGLPMRGAYMLYTMLGLGVRPSFSRPSVSNDNPHVEALFRTMKYSPAYPTKPFASLDAAKKWVSNFVSAYNASMHTRLNYISPLDRHEGRERAILEKRRAVYEAARLLHPNRWSSSVKRWTTAEPAMLNPYGTKMAG